MFLIHMLCALFALCLCIPTVLASAVPLVSTESDPESFIEHCVNVMSGEYCEAATDLVIAGPDALVLQRFFSTHDAVTGNQEGAFRIVPQRFLVIGKDISGKTRHPGEHWSYAFVGERSGGILPYCGWKGTNGVTQDPLKIDILNSAPGMVNTYAEKLGGQTNHQNNALHCRGTSAEVVLGDGSRRFYQKVDQLPSLLLGEELTPLMAHQVVNPEYFLLTQEILPSGNRIFFSYDAAGHLISMEMKNKSLNKVLSWIHFTYTFHKAKCQVHITTSDARKLDYHLTQDRGLYRLTKVEGSHSIPVRYEYATGFIKKILPEGRFLQADYQDGKVIALKGPQPESGYPVSMYTFAYHNNSTDVFNALGVKTRYEYDERFQLTAVKRYDDLNQLYRTEQRFWGRSPAEAGRLLAKTISSSQHVLSYRCFQYDLAGNIIEEKLYGNLTGKQEVSLQVSSDGMLLNPEDQECHCKTFAYSKDGFNLLIQIGDCKGNKTVYSYKPGTNLLTKKLIFDQKYIKKRTFQFYNEDGVCIKTIDDDGSEEEESDLWHVRERHITLNKPKEFSPGVGLPEVITESAVDLKKGQEILIKKLVNQYDDQAHLLSCSTYDANDKYAFTETKAYNSLGQVIAESNAKGLTNHYTYDSSGNQISTLKDNITTVTRYNLRNQPVEITGSVESEQWATKNTYDLLGRKIASTDRFGNITEYAYDAFHRLTEVVHPEVPDEQQNMIRPTYRYTYDVLGNILTLQDPKGFIITKSYNLRGSPTQIHYPDGSSELFKYDVEGSLHRTLSRKQIITVYEYDYLGRLTHEESSTANETGVEGFINDRVCEYNGFRCTQEASQYIFQEYFFDPAGRLSVFVKDMVSSRENEGYSPNSHLTEMAYDALGRLQRKKVWFDVGEEDYSFECLEHDVLGNITEKRLEDAKGQILLRKGFAYDAQNHCIEEYGFENGAKKTIVKTLYDASGQIVGYLDALGQKTDITLDHHYKNRFGQTVLKKTIVSPLGIQTEIEFDTLSRIYNVSKKGSQGTLLTSQTLLYDAIGNKACEMNDQIREGKILDCQKRRWTYGPMGRLEEEIEAADTPLEKRTYYSYDALGKLTGKTTPNHHISYSYNKNGTLHTIEAADHKEKQCLANTYTYKCDGNLISASTFDGIVTQRSYNAFDQVGNEFCKFGEGEDDSYNISYNYDRKGRLTEIMLPDWSRIRYTYDAAFVRKIERLSPYRQVLYTHTYDSYDTQGNLLSESYHGDIKATYAYDASGQKICEDNPFFSKHYNRDTLGRIEEVTGDQHEEYAYNALSQLILEKKQTIKTHTYDSLDNRVQTDNEELLYNGLNQLTSHSTAEFSYDPQGNLLRKVLNGEETHFTSNALSQLLTVEKSDVSTTFSYDALGRPLIQRQVNPSTQETLSTTRYIYVDYQEIGTLSSVQKGPLKKMQTLKVPGVQGSSLLPTSISFELNGHTYVPLHDTSGNVTHLVDPKSKQIVERYEHTAFGEETLYNSQNEVIPKSLVDNPWRFAEKRIDSQSGLILFGLRFYDPAMGRWISQDPAGLIDGPNVYAYLHNNPLSYFDRFGLASEPISEIPPKGYLYGEVETHCYCERHRTCKRGGDIGKTRFVHLPTITYDDYFEKFYKDYRNEDVFIKDAFDNAMCYDLNSFNAPNPPAELGFGFINGVWNNFDGSRASTRYLSTIAAGFNIHAVYNPTHGYFTDLFECFLGSNFIATNPVRQLHKMWDSFFEKRSASAKFLMICHSQGATHVRNALLDYPPELRERILVVAIAPASYIYKETCAQVIHYRAEWHRDLVPRIDFAGAQREKESVVTLSSDPNASLFDHEFMSPTYKERLQEHIRHYIQTKGDQI